MNPKDFRELLSTDIWIMEQMLSLPENPPGEEWVDSDGNKRYSVYVSSSMSDQQEAVKRYRNNLTPSIFVVTQKVYSELFRLFLSQNSFITKSNQSDVETMIKENLDNFSDYRLFGDRKAFEDWWNGKYDYKKLRLSRNKVVHDKYDFKENNKLIVKNSRDVLIEWTSNDVINFTKDVLKIAKSII